MPRTAFLRLVLAAALAVPAAAPVRAQNDRGGNLNELELIAGVDPFAADDDLPAPALRILIRPTAVTDEVTARGMGGTYATTDINQSATNVLHGLLYLHDLADESDIAADLPDGRYDVIWNVPGTIPRAERVALLRAAGKAFFDVTIRVETRTVPTLTLKRTDGDGPPAADPDTPTSMRWENKVNGPRTVVIRACDGGQIANDVQNLTQLPTFDETGLDGEYDLDLAWTQPRSAGFHADPKAMAGALEEYGLTLERRDRPLRFAVVENR